jgi:hypothetical protein
MTLSSLKSPANQAVAKRPIVGDYEPGDLKLDHLTGELTFAHEEGGALFPVVGWRYAALVHGFGHGYVVTTAGGGFTERHLTPMVEHRTKPVPDEPYTEFGKPGPVDAIELVLACVSPEPGFMVRFTACGRLSRERILALLERARRHLDAEGGRAGFIHPVVLVTPDRCRPSKVDHDVWFFDAWIVDWLHVDLAMLWSRRECVA